METGKLNLVNKRQLKGCTNRYLSVKIQYNNSHYLYVGTDNNIYELIIPRHISDSADKSSQEDSFSFKNFKSLESKTLKHLQISCLSGLNIDDNAILFVILQNNQIDSYVLKGYNIEDKSVEIITHEFQYDQNIIYIKALQFEELNILAVILQDNSINFFEIQKTDKKLYQLEFLYQMQFDSLVIDFDYYFINNELYLSFIDLEGSIFLRSYKYQDPLEREEDPDNLDINDNFESQIPVFQNQVQFQKRDSLLTSPFQIHSHNKLEYLEKQKSQQQTPQQIGKPPVTSNQFCSIEAKNLFQQLNIKEQLDIKMTNSFCKFYPSNVTFLIDLPPKESIVQQQQFTQIQKSSSEGYSGFRKNSENLMFDNQKKTTQKYLNLIVANTDGVCYDFDNIAENYLNDITPLPTVNIKNAGITGIDLYMQKNGDLDLFVSYFNGSLINYGKKFSENKHKWKLELNQPLNSNHYGVYFCKTSNDNEDILILISDNIIEQYRVSNYSIN